MWAGPPPGQSQLRGSSGRTTSTQPRGAPLSIGPLVTSGSPFFLIPAQQVRQGEEGEPAAARGQLLDQGHSARAVLPPGSRWQSGDSFDFPNWRGSRSKQAGLPHGLVGVGQLLPQRLRVMGVRDPAALSSRPHTALPGLPPCC